jgi:hypothetical protein
MRYDVELAKLLMNKGNKSYGALLGDVINISPLEISIFGGKAILSDDQCYVCSGLKENIIRKADIKINTTTNAGEITLKEVLKVGDQVLCLPIEDGQTFFIIDKVVL